jgi:hypothetical protein
MIGHFVLIHGRGEFKLSRLVVNFIHSGLSAAVTPLQPIDDDGSVPRYTESGFQ